MGKLWNFESFAESPALIADSGITLTYHDLDSLSDTMEKEIGKSGCLCDTFKQLTMFVCRNTLGALSGYAALINRGYPMLPVSDGLPVRIRKDLMNVYRPRLLLLPLELRNDHPAMREICTIRDYVLLKTNYPECFPVHSQLGLLITTSGSTGSVKLVRQSWDNLRFNAATIAECLQISASDRTITALPLQYTYGLSILHANLLRGAAMVITTSGVMDAEFWDLFEAENVTCFHGVPNTYDMLHRIELFEDDFPCLRLMSQAGGRLSPELQKYYGQYAGKQGKQFVIMYGLSEATAAISWLPPEDILRKPGSAGIIIPGGSVSLIDEDNNPVTGAHRRGELVYRGPNVAMGYAQQGEDLQLGDEWNGVLRTGDIAEIDEDGYYTITGRRKRYLKMSGHRISLDEVDSMIMDELGIFAVSVGTDDHLVIFVTDEKEEEPVRSFIRTNVLSGGSDIRILTIPEFPKNEGGKILYAVLQEAVQDSSC